MIKDIRYSKLDLPKLRTLSGQSRTTINQNHPEDPVLSPLLQAVNEALDKADTAIGSTQKEALTEQVRQADAFRDDNLAGLADHVKAGVKRHSNPAYMEACQRLHALFVQHGRSLIRAPYANQSALMDALIADLKTPQATTNATEWFQELTTDEQNFKQLFLKRNEEAAGRDIPTDEEAFRALKKAVENLYTVINAFYLSNQIEGLEPTIKVINETIDRVGGDFKLSINQFGTL